METQTKPKPNKLRPLPTLAVSVLPDQIEQLEELARRRFTSKSSLVREALAFYLAANSHITARPKEHVA